MKAFLSHSSNDKSLVDNVAKELGRQFCIYDSYAFDTGEEFKRSIKIGLDDSDVFVLFASKNSIPSTWVEFEINEAEHRRSQGLLDTTLVFIIDQKTSHKDLPSWLQRTLVKSENSPQAISRLIRRKLRAIQFSEATPGPRVPRVFGEVVPRKTSLGQRRQV